MKEIMKEVRFVMKGKYLLGRRKMCLGPNMPLLCTKLYCGADEQRKELLLQCGP